MSLRLYFMLVITWERNNSLSYTLPHNTGSLLRVHLHNGNHQNNKNEREEATSNYIIDSGELGI